MTYCAVAEVKGWMNVSDDQLDAVIDVARDAAEAWINDYCHRNFNLDTAATARYFDVNPNGDVVIDDIGDSASVTVATDDSITGTYSTAWSASDFQLLPRSQGHRVNSFTKIRSTGTRTFPAPSPLRVGLVRVTAKWGWPAVPVPVKQACIEQTARIVHARNSPGGIEGFNDFGIVRSTSVDRRILDKLDPYVRSDGFA